MNLVLLLFLCRLAWPGLISYNITYKNSELILLYKIFGQIMVVCISKIERKNYFLQIQNSNTVKKYNFLYGFSINTFLNFSQECNCFTVLLKYPTFAVGFFIFCQNRLNIYVHVQSTAAEYIPYARHYNLRFVYFKATFEGQKLFFKNFFLRKFCLYVWLVFQSGF